MRLIAIQLRLGEGDSEMLLSELPVVHPDEGDDGFLRRIHGQQRHLLCLVEKLTKEIGANTLKIDGLRIKIKSVLWRAEIGCGVP